MSKLLGPPMEIDFVKEAERRALRKGFMLPRVVPSDDQYRYLWRYDSCPSGMEQMPMALDVCAQCIGTGHSLERSELCRCCSASVIIESSSQSVEHERSVKTTDTGSTASLATSVSSPAARALHTGLKRTANNASNEFARKRTWINMNSGGWISRSNFYKDDGVPAVANVPSRFSEPLSKKDNTSVNNGSDTVGATLSLKRNNSCPTSNEVRDKMTTLDATFNVVGSPEENVVNEQSRRRKRGILFRPTSKRANQRLKQTSLFHMFRNR